MAGLPPLWKALSISPGDLVAFTGGGGKSALALALLRELAAAGCPALFTTTTRIFPIPGLPLLLAEDAPRDWPERVAEALAGGPVSLGRRLDRETGKVTGIAPDEVARLKERLGSTAVILAEADGSAGLPLKAPAPHEPVIPTAADLVIPVAGARVLGQPLTPAHVHRPDRVAALAGLAPGSPVTPEVVAAALLAPDGCTRGTPPGARVVPVVGQADHPGVPAGARFALMSLLSDQAGRAVLAAPQSDRPVRAIAGPVAAIVLAGGGSRRFGGGKLMHPYPGGGGALSLLEASLRAPLRAALREVVVVTGAYHTALAPLLAPYPVSVVANPDWQTGVASSLQAGLRALSPDVQAVVVCLGDQPELPPQVIDALVESWRRTGAPLVAPLAGGRRCNPVLFDRALWPELMQVTGDEGGRAVVQRHSGRMVTVPFDQPAWFRDIDTPDDLQ